MANLRPVTDRDVDPPPPPPPPPPPLASLQFERRAVEALVRAGAQGRTLTARELCAEAHVKGRVGALARAVFIHDDLVAAILGGEMRLRDAGAEAQRRADVEAQRRAGEEVVEVEA